MGPGLSHALWREVIGHDEEKEQLYHLLQANTVPHALLFSGPAGVGKRRMARAFAASLLLKRTSPGSESRDSESEVIRMVANGVHPDLLLVDREEGKRDITVETVRKLCADLRLKPYSGGCSVAIIDNAHLMNIAANNALLMTLEEPAVESYIILVSDESHRLLETIVSRCQTIHFGELQREHITAILRKLLGEADLVNLKLEDLVDFAGSSLARLELDSLVDNKTLSLLNQKAALEHLGAVAGESRHRENLLAGLVASGSAGFAMALAADFADKTEGSSGCWRAISAFVRRRLLLSSGKAAQQWAELLSETLRAEQRVLERNTNLKLELSAVLLAISQLESL